MKGQALKVRHFEVLFRLLEKFGESGDRLCSQNAFDAQSYEYFEYAA